MLELRNKQIAASNNRAAELQNKVERLAELCKVRGVAAPLGPPLPTRPRATVALPPPGRERRAGRRQLFVF